MAEVEIVREKCIHGLDYCETCESETRVIADETAEVTEEQVNFIQRFNAMPKPKPEKPKLGIGIKVVNGFVHIAFNHHVEMLTFTKKEAREFARRIVKESLK